MAELWARPVMGGLLSAVAATFQLMLKHFVLWGAVMISESLRHISVLLVFSWEILVGALAVVSLRVKRRHTSRVKAPARRCSVHKEASARCGERIGEMTEADALESPGVEASPVLLQTMCLRALNRELSRMSRQNTADLLKTARKSQPPKLPQVTHEKPVSKASGRDGGQLEKNLTDNLNKNTHPKSPELLKEEMMRRKHKIEEKEEERQRWEQSNPRTEQVLQNRASQPLSAAASPLQTVPQPDDLGHHVDEGNLEFLQKRKAENEDRFVQGLEVDLKGVPHHADTHVSQEIARQLREQKQVSEKLTTERTSLEIKKVLLQREKANLKDEMQALRLKLRIRQETHRDLVTQLQTQLCEERRRHSELEKKFPIVWRNMDSTYQRLQTYEKMAQDMNQELQRSSFYYQNEIQYLQKKAEEAWLAAEFAERKFQHLWRENEHDRQMLAKVKSKFQPFPGGPFGPAALPAADRGPPVPGRPLSHQVSRKRVTQ